MGVSDVYLSHERRCCLASRATEVRVIFKQPRRLSFLRDAKGATFDQLLIRIQPEKVAALAPTRNEPDSDPEKLAAVLEPQSARMPRGGARRGSRLRRRQRLHSSEELFLFRWPRPISGRGQERRSPR